MLQHHRDGYEKPGGCFMDSIIPQNDVSDAPAKKFCPRCEQWLLTSCFGKQKSSKDGLQFYCKSCQSTMRTSTYVRRRDQGLCLKCLVLTSHQSCFCEQCSSQQNLLRRENGVGRTATKRYMDKLRDEVFAIYGGACIVCGESHPAFLSVDHMNNDGAEHRQNTGNGRRFYQWLRKNNFPQEGFQLLCANCNWRKYVSLKGSEKTYHRHWYTKLRQEIIDAYQGVCSCCGEDRPEVLTIDHVHNDGAEHRREIGHGGANLYAWLHKQGFPQDGRFALLCFNCNIAKQHYGVCPHQ